jgi:hypothetical protein
MKKGAPRGALVVCGWLSAHLRQGTVEAARTIRPEARFAFIQEHATFAEALIARLTT